MRLPTSARRAISSTRPPARPPAANSPIAAARMLRRVAAGSRGRWARRRRVPALLLTPFMTVTYRPQVTNQLQKSTVVDKRAAHAPRVFVRPTGRRRMTQTQKLAAVAFVLLGFAAPAAAADKVSFILNWVAGGDHAPYYYARAKGWYADAGLDVDLIQGSGSSVAAQRAGAGVNQFGLADMTTVLVAVGKGADEVAIMNIYANYPGGFYWLKSSGINGIKDLAGKKIGNPPGDAARALWPALAKANHIDPKSVTWVNLSPNGKLPALKAGSVDAVTEFYNLHHGYKREIGSDLGYLAWKDAGLNPYGNSIVVNGAYLKEHHDTVAAFVKVTQKAFAACVAEPKACVQALVDANSGLTPDDQLVKDYIGIEKPFDVTKRYTNEFLDKSIKMKAVKFEG